MSHPAYSWTAVIIAHATLAAIAVLLGSVLLVMRKGHNMHRLMGWTWVLCMAAVAGISFAIHRPDGYSWIHGLSVFTLVSLFIGQDGAATGQPIWRRLALPWFITAFLGVVALNSLVSLPAEATKACLTGSKALLLLAVTATAMRSRMDLLLEMGWRAAIPVVIATLASFAASLGFALLLL